MRFSYISVAYASALVLSLTSSTVMAEKMDSKFATVVRGEEVIPSPVSSNQIDMITTEKQGNRVS